MKQDFRTFARPSLFGAVAILFLMPFAAVSCAGGGPVMATFSGLDLAFGTTVDMMGEPATLSAQLLVTLALVSTVIGLLLGFARARAALFGSIIAGGVAAGSLIIFVFDFEAVVVRETEGAAQATYGTALWLSVAVLIGAAVWNGVLYGAGASGGRRDGALSPATGTSSLVSSPGAHGNETKLQTPPKRAHDPSDKRIRLIIGGSMIGAFLLIVLAQWLTGAS